ncbi:MAG: hypothetical protein M3Z57_00915 [Candidatus Dormibacteraeota bacterium]|nr:hypothetical protein [Candidatus Dormibacteraeota bacterium]
MNLTIAEVAELPLGVALLDRTDVLAHTPEWRGPAPGSVTYRVRRARLVVSADDRPDPVCADVVEALLEEIDRTRTGLPRRQALRVAMLAASLRIVAGRDLGAPGASADVLEHACAGIASRTNLTVSVCNDRPFSVLGPEAAALVLVQLAANAERHEGAVSVHLSAARNCFSVGWRGPRRHATATTARRRGDRQRWGLGFARIAADCIGGVVHPPVSDGDGGRSAVLETGLGRLSLPLALVRDGAVHKATRAWDEETSLLPGHVVPAKTRAARCVAAAARTPGQIARLDGWSVRTCAAGTWLAIPPDGIVDRARDVLDGMVHERALWDGVPEPARSRIVALAAILGSMLGADLERVPGDTWNRRAPGLARAFGWTTPLPVFRGAGAVDPRVALFLASEFGDTLEASGDDLYLRIRPDQRDNALVRVFLSPGNDSIRLS